MKLKIHPLFLILGVILAICGQIVPFLIGIASVIAHEFAHSIVAKYFGYYLNTVSLLPYGAKLFGEENIRQKDEKYIALAGPIFSLVISLIAVGLWWIIPNSFYYTKDFAYINFELFLINLLPAYPLDGSRIVLSVAKNRIKALKIVKLLGVVLSVCFMIIFIVSAFYSINFTIGIFSVFLFIGATDGVSKEQNISLYTSSFIAKRYDVGVEKKEIIVSKNLTLLHLVRMLSPNYFITFIVVDGESTSKISENKLQNLTVKYPLNTKIGNIK